MEREARVITIRSKLNVHVRKLSLRNLDDCIWTGVNRVVTNQAQEHALDRVHAGLFWSLASLRDAVNGEII